MFDLKHKLLIGALGVALLSVGVVFRSWLSAHDAMVNAEATVKAQQTAFDTAAKSLKDLEASDAARARETASKVQVARTEAAKAVSPEEIASYLVSKWGLPVGSSLMAASEPKSGTITPSVLAIPAENLPDLKRYTSDCEVCKLERASLKTDVTSRDEQLKLAGAELSAVERERDAYKKAVKGTFWGRTKSAFKWIAIGGAVGLGAVCGTGHCK